jgi:FkbM family methyltransferase
MAAKLQNWFDADGDNTLALDWPLDESSHVWEIGGFEGRWAAQIYEKFHCNITIFEPQLWAVERMQERFKGMDKIEIRPYGLWMFNSTMALGDYYTDGASLYKTESGKPKDVGFFRSVHREIRNFEPPIDLALMNIEGAEYDLLPVITSSGLIKRMKRFWCQFHPTLVLNGSKRTELVFSQIEKTHRMLWNCFPFAVAWKVKEGGRS